MPRIVLIAETTREERIKIVESALGWGDECDGMSGLSSGVDKMYQPYIDGELELAECNRRMAGGSYVQSERGMWGAGGSCTMGY